MPCWTLPGFSADLSLTAEFPRGIKLALRYRNNLQPFFPRDIARAECLAINGIKSQAGAGRLCHDRYFSQSGPVPSRSSKKFASVTCWFCPCATAQRPSWRQIGCCR